jgi:hypothetical protein
MSKKKVISMLESIPQYESISETNKIYSRLFKKYSLNNLILNLKNIKSFHPKSILDKLIEQDLKLNNIKNNNYLETLNFLDNLIKKKKEIPKNTKIEKINSKTKNNEHINQNFSSIIEYNPNYNSIYKKVYVCRIAPLKTESNNNNKKIKLLKKSKKFSSNNSPIKAFNSFSKNSNTENNNDKKSFSKRKISYILPEIKNNHSLKFSDYSNRIYPPKSDSVGHVSYIEPYNYLNNKKNIINFNNNSKRNEIINKTNLEIPPSSYYKPKYDYVEKHSSNCIFGNVKNNKNLHKKYLFKKYLFDYNTDSNYKFIDNDKLMSNEQN